GVCPAYENLGYDKDELLLHGLVHALRELRGECSRPTGDSDWMTEEEFFAGLVCNIYLSEKGKKDLRGNHPGCGPLTAPLNTSEGFLGKGAAPPSRAQLEHRRLVSKFVTQSRGLCDDICHKVTAADFNPIREYLCYTSLYPHDPRKVRGK